MNRLNSFIWLFGLPCLLVLVSWRTLTCPYSKVEESFTIQAVHDILSYGVGAEALPQYDHQVFPGAVPRSFIGPLALAAFSYPWILASRSLQILQTSADAQSIVRLCLAAANTGAIAFFGQLCFTLPSTARKAKGTTSHKSSSSSHVIFFLTITAVQFHFPFWASRTIPNSLALPFVVVAIALVCRNIGTDSARSSLAVVDARNSIALLVFSAVVLRLEIVATLIPVGLYLLVTRKIALLDAIRTGLTSAATSVLLTSAIDTYFWQDLAHKPYSSMASILVSFLPGLKNEHGYTPLWPELNALFFNVVEGKSSEWGVSPWHAYYTSLMPRLLAFTAPFVLVGLAQLLRFHSSPLEQRARFLVWVAAFHIGMLSMLGHKEWRFAVYVVPGLNVVAAIGAGILFRSRPGRAVVTGLLLLQMGLSGMTGYLSAINYPGGEALKRLHDHLGPDSTNVVVHIDVLPAMTGVTLFQSVRMERKASTGLMDRFAGILPRTSEGFSWVYDKTENLAVSGPDAAAAWSSYTHLLTDAPDCRILRGDDRSRLAGSEQPFETITSVTSFAGLRRKTISQIKQDLLDLPRAILEAAWRVVQPARGSFDRLVRLGLPVVIVEEPSVWLCRRKRKQ